MIEKLTTNAKINSTNDSILKLFYLIKLLFNKVNEVIEVVNKLENK